MPYSDDELRARIEMLERIIIAMASGQPFAMSLDDKGRPQLQAEQQSAHPRGLAHPTAYFGALVDRPISATGNLVPGKSKRMRIARKDLVMPDNTQTATAMQAAKSDHRLRSVSEIEAQREGMKSR